MKTSELIGPALDWAVMKIEGRVLVQTLGGGLLVNGRHEDGRELPEDWQMTFMWHPSTDWEQGGPIIEREEIDVYCHESPKSGCGWWVAEITGTGVKARGNSYLVAAMRAFVASKLGDEIEIPEELI